MMHLLETWESLPQGNTDRVRAFHISSHFYNAVIRLLGNVERNYPFVKEDIRFGNEELYLQKHGKNADIVSLSEWTFFYNLLEDDAAFTERVMDGIEETHGREAAARVREVFIDGSTQEEAAARNGLTRRQLQYAFTKYLNCVEPIVVSADAYHASMDEFLRDTKQYHQALQDRMRAIRKRIELDRQINAKLGGRSAEDCSSTQIERLLENRDLINMEICRYERIVNKVNSTILHIPNYTYRWVAYAYYIIGMTLISMSLEADLNVDYMSRSMKRYINAVFAEGKHTE